MKLSNSNRTFAIAAAAILMSAYQLSPIQAWACSASSSGGFAYSSNTGPTSVTVCASSVVSTRAVAVSTKTPAIKAPSAKPPTVKAPVSKAPAAPAQSKPAPKTPPAPAKSLLTQIKKGVPIALQKPVAKPAPKPAPKPVAVSTPPKTPAKSTVATASTTSATSSGEVSFSPAPISLSSSETRAQVGQEVTFWANTSTHYKTGLLLGKVTDVKFTPIETRWSSDQGHTAVGGSASFVFDGSGSIEVMASVTYAVAYQISGASGWIASGEIKVWDSIAVTIEEAPELLARPETPSSQVVRLVGKNCLSRTAVFGCNP